MSTLNKAGQEFHEQVKCYKVDLACSLQQVIQSYNTIFLQQYEAFYKTESEKEKLYEQELKLVTE